MHSPACSWVPALATNTVAHIAPGQGVAAALAHGVLRVALAVRPPGVEVSVVSSLRVASDLTPLEGSYVGIIAGSDFTEHVERSGDDAERGGGRQEDGGEGNHCE